MSRVETTDFVIIGGGIVGLTTALELKRRLPDSSVTLIEKEAACGLHASGRNSGVLHAGFYYTSDSFKARFSRDGNRELTEYCDRKGLAIRKCGKLVVARSEAELPVLAELLERGAANGVPLERISAAEAAGIEPAAKTTESALYSPTTSSVDPVEVVEALASDARAAGIRIRLDSGYLKRAGSRVRTRVGELEAGYVVNAAGLYADRIAQDYGFGEHHRILPFKGRYLIRSPGTRDLRTHVYPVPDLRYPFLGVHFTVAVDGRIKIGPTALPALWREQYGGIGRFRLSELSEIGLREAELFLRDDMSFRRLAWREITKTSKRRLLSLASELAAESHGTAAWQWGRPGIRAQLFDTRSRRLETDFVVQGDERSFHVLNAVSPAFTCAFPFSRFIADEIELRLGHGRGADFPASAAAVAGAAAAHGDG